MYKTTIVKLNGIQLRSDILCFMLKLLGPDDGLT